MQAQQKCLLLSQNVMGENAVNNRCRKKTRAGKLRKRVYLNVDKTQVCFFIATL